MAEKKKKVVVDKKVLEQASGNAASAADAYRNQYAGQLKKAYKDLGQDVLEGSSSDYANHAGGIRGIPRDQFNNVLMNSTFHLADVFANEYAKKYGRAPSVEEIGKFVSESYTPEYGRGFITQEIGGRVRSRIVPEYFDYNPPEEVETPTAEAGPVAGLKEKYDELFGRLEGLRTESISREVDKAYDPLRKRTIEERAVLGNLRQPTTAGVLGEQDIERENTRSARIADFIAKLTGQRIEGETDIAKTLENIRMQEEGARTQARQFSQTLGLKRRALAGSEENAFQENLLGERELSLSERLGRMQAEAAKPGAWDRAIQVVSALGGLGAGASGLAAGGKAIGGLFKRKKASGGTSYETA